MTTRVGGLLLCALAAQGPGPVADEGSLLAAQGFGEASWGKDRALLEGILEHRRGTRPAEAIRLRREWREALARHGRAFERIAQAEREGKPRAEIEALQEEAGAHLGRIAWLARRLREVSPWDAQLDVEQGVDPAAVRTALGPGRALVEFVEEGERLSAYVIRENAIAHVGLGESEPIRAAVGAFLSRLSSADDIGTPARIASEGRRLFDRLLAPALREAGAGIERLVVVPAPSLAGVPFEALVTGTRGDEPPRAFADVEFVIDRYEIAYAPSSPVVVVLSALGPRKETGKVLVLADPLYPLERGGEPSPERPFARATKTRDEALAIARLLLDPGDRDSESALSTLSSRRSGSLSTWNLDLHLGAEAAPRRLAGDLKPYSILHLAGRGFVDIEFPSRGGIELSSSGREPGTLSIADVLELDLEADLVVLSAGETARGPARAGGSVESLARAFLYAGSRAVVASLWRTSEEAAFETMQSFYRATLKGAPPPSRALREAKLAIRRSDAARGTARPGASVESAHPHFWAPFIYIGLSP